eukprot:489624_1
MSSKALRTDNNDELTNGNSKMEEGSDSNGINDDDDIDIVMNENNRQIEQILDNVQNNSLNKGQLFNEYRVKWKNLPLTKAIWIPKDELSGDNIANYMIKLYHTTLSNYDVNDKEIKKIRINAQDKELLDALWNVLQSEGDDNDNICSVIWTDGGRSFNILNLDKFTANFIKEHLKDINVNDFISFSNILIK